MTPLPEQKDCLRIGRIVGFHGLKGDTKVRPADRDASWSDSLESVLVFDAKTGQPRRLKISGSKHNGPHVLLRFTEYPDRTAAEPLMGLELYAIPDELPEPENDEYYANDLIGLNVFLADSTDPCAIVQDLVSSTGADFLELKLVEDGKVIVVPFQTHFFPLVDLKARRLTLSLPPGFLDASH
jgi:16S rRNA processing protein RimM